LRATVLKAKRRGLDMRFVGENLAAGEGDLFHAPVGDLGPARTQRQKNRRKNR
jgi:hypothetical protein